MASSNSPCAACKFLRRKCTQGCVFAPYFPPDQPQKFANVHRVFGASNVAKLLNELSPVQREDAVNSLAYEADARLRDPVYGCVGYISILQHKLKQVQMDLFAAKKELANYIGPAAHGPFLPHHHHHHHPSAFAPPPLHPHFPSPSSAPPFGVPGSMGMGLGLSAAASPQMLLREQQQQQQLVEAQQQLAVVAAAREQELLRYEQQHELARLSGGFDGRGFNPMGGGGAVVVAAGLGLVPSQQFHENNNSSNLPFPLHHHQQQQHQHQLQLQFPEHHQPQPQHHRDGSDEGRSGIGPSS